MANIYIQSDEIFNDLMDLCGVVVLFDEVDALTQKRSVGVDRPDTETQFLTTSMLPKLAGLHDRGGIVFLMATNFKTNFDAAITRSGRFDLLLCMGPPSLKEKISKFRLYFKPEPSVEQCTKAQNAINGFLEKEPKHADMLSLLTFGECKALFGRVGDETNIGDRLQAMSKDEFLKRILQQSESSILSYRSVEHLNQSPLEKIDELAIEKLETIKHPETKQYFLERRESRRQY